MKKFRFIGIAIFILVLGMPACNATLPQIGQAQTPAPTIIIEPPSSTGSNLPRTEADVPRVSVEGARVALESGEAMIVDVRSAQAYAGGHIPGAISMPLDRMEADPAAFNLKKDQWIITYCT
jgi:3-mercaptopyruvate sulfurtransferase SseA